MDGFEMISASLADVEDNVATAKILSVARVAAGGVVGFVIANVLEKGRGVYES